MSPNILGAIVGFAVGFLGFIFIRLMAKRIEDQKLTAEPEKAAKVLRTVAWADLAVFTVVGYVIGPMLESGSGS